jgi:hypothetical protein
MEANTIDRNERRRAVKKIAVGAAVVGAMAAGAGKFIDISSQSKGSLNSPDTQTILTSQGLILPSLTSDPANPVAGQMWYRSDAGVTAHFDAVQNRVVYSSEINDGNVHDTSKGIINGLSVLPNDGTGWFGPDTTKGATAPGQYGSPYTETSGMNEAGLVSKNITLVGTDAIFLISASIVLDAFTGENIFDNGTTTTSYQITGNGAVIKATASMAAVLTIGALEDEIFWSPTVTNLQIYADGIADYALQLLNVQNAIVTGCIIGAATTANLYIAANSYMSSTNGGSSDTQILNNGFTNPVPTSSYGVGIMIGTYVNSTYIRSNAFNNCYEYAITDLGNYIDDSSGYVISNNFFFYTQGYDIGLLVGSNSVIANNGSADAYNGFMYYNGPYPLLGDANLVISGNAVQGWGRGGDGESCFYLGATDQDNFVQGLLITGNSIGIPAGSNTGYVFTIATSLSTPSLVNKITGNFITNSTAITVLNVLTISTPFDFSNNFGYVPTPTTPAVPTSGTAQQNANPYPVEVYINGGTVTEIQITRNGTAYTVFSVSTAIAMSGQAYKLNPGDSITVTYSTAPTWEWLSD